MEIITTNSINNKIHNIRGLQVMLDSDLAELYGIGTKVLNQGVKRNIERFPIGFMFQITLKEYENLKYQNGTSSSKYNHLKSQNATLEESNILRSQIVTSSLEYPNLKSPNATSSFRWGGRRKLPFAFTEQGVAMLSGVLRTETAVKVSLQIIEAFVSMRKFILKNGEIFGRLDYVERKQIEYQISTDNKFDKVFNAIESKQITPKQGIFFEGQIFDAHKFISDLIRSANKSIILIDNYVDDSVLTLFSERDNNIDVVIYTSNLTSKLRLDLDKYNSQYPKIEIEEFKHSHDRFLIIDNKEVYHIGASLKDLGKKWFAFSKFDKEALKLLERI